MVNSDALIGTTDAKGKVSHKPMSLQPGSSVYLVRCLRLESCYSILYVTWLDAGQFKCIYVYFISNCAQFPMYMAQ
jgi:hypothetical protein